MSETRRRIWRHVSDCRSRVFGPTEIPCSHNGLFLRLHPPYNYNYGELLLFHAVKMTAHETEILRSVAVDLHSLPGPPKRSYRFHSVVSTHKNSLMLLFSQPSVSIMV